MEAKKENKDYLALLSIYTGKDPVEILDEILDAQRAKDHDTLETIYLLMGKMWPPKRPAQKKTEPAQPKKKGGAPEEDRRQFRERYREGSGRGRDDCEDVKRRVCRVLLEERSCS